MTLPELPLLNEDPWFDKRNAFDIAVRDEIEGTSAEGVLLDTVATGVENPETALHAAVGQVVADQMSAGVPNVAMVFKESMANPTAARPVWAGVVDWWVSSVDIVPVNMADGDLRTVVSEEGQSWRPSHLASLRAWWSAASVGAGPVSTLSDLSGRGRAMVLNNGVVNRDMGMNGKPSLSLNGGSLRSSFSTPITGDTLCIWWTGYSTATSATGFFFFGNGVSNNGRAQAFRQGTAQGGKFGAYLGTNAGQVLSASSDSAPHVFMLRATAGGSSELWIDGVSVGTASTAGLESLSMLRLGDREGSDRPLQGGIGEMFITEGAPSVEERSAAFAYLAESAGLVL